MAEWLRPQCTICSSWRSKEMGSVFKPHQRERQINIKRFSFFFFILKFVDEHGKVQVLTDEGNA